MRFLVRIHGACPNNAICVFSVPFSFFSKDLLLFFHRRKAFSFFFNYVFFFSKDLLYSLACKTNYILRDFFTTEFKYIYFFPAIFRVIKNSQHEILLKKKMFFFIQIVFVPKKWQNPAAKPLRIVLAFRLRMEKFCLKTLAHVLKTQRASHVLWGGGVDCTYFF